MTSRFRRTAVIAALVGVGLFAAPVAAQASTIYPPSDACKVTPITAAPGAAITFSCEAGTFAANESVKITITGENGGQATFGFVRFAVTTGAHNTSSGPAGELASTRITLPAETSGIHNIAAISESSAGGTASVTVKAAGDTLTPTGGNNEMLGLYAGGGLLLLAGGAIAITVAVRRRNKSQ